jgi:hypothetical protein
MPYQTALRAGQYDIYYGEIKLTSDFDLTGIWALRALRIRRFGREWYNLINGFNKSGEETREEAAKALYSYLSDNGMLLRFCLKSVLFSHTGA